MELGFFCLLSLGKSWTTPLTVVQPLASYIDSTAVLSDYVKPEPLHKAPLYFVQPLCMSMTSTTWWIPERSHHLCWKFTSSELLTASETVQRHMCRSKALVWSVYQVHM